MAFTGSQRDLLRLAAAARGDYMLHRLVALANAEPAIGAVVNLLVGGMVVQGRLERDEDFADFVDDQLVKAIGRAQVARVPAERDARDPAEGEKSGIGSGGDVESEAEVRASVIEAYRERRSLGREARERRRSRQRISKDIAEAGLDERDIHFRDQQEESGREWFFALSPPPMLTLGEARVVAPPTATGDAGRMRVRLSAISAWWVPEHSEASDPRGAEELGQREPRARRSAEVAEA
jgi:hypothetical protein